MTTDAATLVAVASAVAAAGLAGPAAARLGPSYVAAGWSRRPAPLLVALVVTAAGLLVASVSAVLVVAGVVAVGVVAGLGHLLRLRRLDRTAREARGRVVEACVALSAELAAGRPPDAALDRAATEWPHLAPAARAAAAGGDVPDALRALAAAPGAGALRQLAAAWQVSHHTGRGLGSTLDRVASDLRAADRTRRLVEGELASARATSRLLAGLPLVALAMGAGAGAAPWSFLFAHPAGLACLAAGLAFEYAGLVWIEALARDVLGRA